MAMAKVKVPPFTKGKKQLEKIAVDWSRELPVVRIHVEKHSAGNFTNFIDTIKMKVIVHQL